MAENTAHNFCTLLFFKILPHRPEFPYRTQYEFPYRATVKLELCVAFGFNKGSLLETLD